MKKFLKSIQTAFYVSAAMFILCGLAYPMTLTGIAQVLFPYQANGSLVEENGKIVGSELLGQDFTDERLFHCRPSAYHYNTYTAEDKADGSYGGPASGGYNYAVSNPKLEERINQDIEQFLQQNPTVSKQEIPSDLVTASGSGLDPHISIEAAIVQVDRVVKNTKLEKEKVEALIQQNTQRKLFGIFGEDKVNVLKLNLALVKEMENDFSGK